MATAADFVANPEAFMADNIVQVTTPNPDDVPTDRPVWVTVQDTGLKIMNKPGTVFELYITKTVHSAAKPALRAYFCPYENDKSFFIMLGNDADYMFTPKMDGCSFGIGSQANGACRVGHVNFVNLQTEWKSEGEDVARDRMYQAQRQFLGNRLGVDATRVIDPSEYRGAGLTQAATTFGVRGAGQVWSFKTLRYGKPGSKTYLHHGVHLHVNN
ncbi:MAG: hypothetical protein ABW023_02435 [Sphingomonas sp.]